MMKKFLLVDEEKYHSLLGKPAPTSLQIAENDLSNILSRSRLFDSIYNH